MQIHPDASRCLDQRNAYLHHLRKHTLVSSRSKRWNGNFDSLPATYLKGVAAKMADYGDRVQFSLLGGGPEPSYQVMNADGRAMAFDRNHHLLRPEGEEFTGVNATKPFTLEQINAAIAGVRSSSSAAPRAAKTTRATTGARTTAAKLEEQLAAQRYEYFKNHRQSLPAGISDHAEEIMQGMKLGKSVEDAFVEVVKKYF